MLGLIRRQQQDAVGTASAILAVAGVVASWAVVNTVHASTDARMYDIDNIHSLYFARKKTRRAAISRTRRSTSACPTARAA